MAKYGRAALLATSMHRSIAGLTPPEAWAKAVKRVFPKSGSSQRKGCPRGAYLGLCEQGLVRGVPPGSYTGSRRNKSYAIRGVTLLRTRPTLADDEDRLWRAVVRGERKTPNNQMDVVIALWKRRLIQD